MLVLVESIDGETSCTIFARRRGLVSADSVGADDVYTVNARAHGVRSTTSSAGEREVG